MQSIDLETAISDFLSLGRRLLSFQPLTGEYVLSELTNWYKNSRVVNASLEENADMLLLQWGTIQPRNTTEAIDLRALSEDNMKALASEYQYLDFTRQVFANNEAGDLEFDDVAIQMSITLYYGPSTGDEPNSNLWIEMPDKIERGVKNFRATPFVSILLNAPASRASITVDHCG